MNCATFLLLLIVFAVFYYRQTVREFIQKLKKSDGEDK